ncbi:lanthionine synthetase LanC family protein [Mucilaginibacter sp. BT774]|uniref:lanthionine synthetase LanC family protein n=1 Tax=Mucilaginibacter sp. BT774 TaxID=3062276 RepID=UPI0026749BC0|nr:lanthionine synthetase LanC family protein [Mucilaginibacter sp. BT774]MDO3627168.1 lanthionine synthetase LanC family protein [Mucilaginibacter sp. BT774]
MKMYSDSLREPIQAKIEKFNRHLLQFDSHSDKIGLYTGPSGASLYMCANYLATGQEIFQDKLNLILDDTIRYIDGSKSLGPSFASGIPGWGWLICHLAEKGMIDPDIDGLLGAIDAPLYQGMINYLKTGYFDPLHGAIGIGRYFLKRKQYRRIETLIDHLDEIKITTDDEIKWRKQNLLSKEEFTYDFGLAHGSAGVIRFLLNCHQLGIRQETCESLIKGSINFLLHNIQRDEQATSIFPSAIPCEVYRSGRNRPISSRLAWCYGDLTILYTLYAATERFGLYELKKDCITYLIKTTNRKSFDETNVVDAGFCHGTAGIAYVYWKLWHATGLARFGQEADYWYVKTLDYDADPSDNLGYNYLIGSFEGRAFKKCDDVLEGNSGVALSLLCYLHPGLADWDESMLLS